MATHDYVIANASGASVRADINNMALAISSNNSASSEPGTIYAYEFWVDTSSNLMKIRNGANNAWITLPYSITASNTVDINGGAIDGTNIGASSAGTGAFTTLSTTDNLSIGGSNKELRFYEGANYVGFEAPALSADKIWVLPTADGSADQVLTTNGSGTLSWSTAGGAWTTSGANIYVTGKDVLIGQTAQTGYALAQKLVVGDGDANDGITIQSGATHQGNLAFNHSDGTTAHGRILYQHNTNYMSFLVNNSEKVRIHSDGDTNIGGFLTAPTDGGKLVLQSGSTALSAYIGNTGFASKVLMLAVEGVTTASNYHFAEFYSSRRPDTGGGDMEFKFRGDGQAYADQNWNNGGADYAEYFEWSDGNSSSQDRVGLSVVLDGNKIKQATASDNAADIIGIISAMPGVVGDTAWNKWTGKYERDDYGRYVMENFTVTEWTVTTTNSDGSITTDEISYETDKIPSGVTPPADAVVVTKDDDGDTLRRRKLNSSYDDDLTYVNREDRKEWDTVGLMGKLRLKKGEPTGTNWIKMRDVTASVEEWLVR